MIYWTRIFLAAICSLMGYIACAQPTESVQIPMRDGKSLAADLYLPNSQDSFPTILIMTPYGKIFYAINGLPLGIGKDITSSNYAVVVVDWRCRFASLSACSVNGDNGEDGYDVVEWIASQPWSTEKVGMWGPSALGNVQYETAAQQPPHLVCCVPEVAAPHFSYDKYYPGGSLKIETVETLDFLFSVANPIVSNPHYNLIWQIVEDGSMYPDQIDIPFLIVGGWYDQNTYQVLRMFDTLRSSSVETVRNDHRLIIGPWVHGGTGQAFVGSAKQGQLNYPAAEGANIQAAMSFFDYHLLDIADRKIESPVTFFQMGSARWMTTASWPPAGVQRMKYYLHADGSLQRNEEINPAERSYPYDPVDPSPSVGGKSLNLELDQGPYDQRDQVEVRDDALIFTTEISDDSLHITGSITAHLYLSSDRVDTDVAVRITDVYPDGRSMLIIDGIQRLRFRNGYRVRDTSFMVPGSVYPVEIRLDDLAVTLSPGHQLRLIITSSNYPRHNRNMNNGEAIHPGNNADTIFNPKIARNTIHMSTVHPSHLSIPVISPSATSHHQNEINDLLWDVYPNPGTGIFEITKPVGQAKLVIYDSYGRRIESHDLSPHDVDRISVVHPQKGVFFFQLERSSHLSVRKVTIL